MKIDSLVSDTSISWWLAFSLRFELIPGIVCCVVKERIKKESIEERVLEISSNTVTTLLHLLGIAKFSRLNTNNCKSCFPFSRKAGKYDTVSCKQPLIISASVQAARGLQMFWQSVNEGCDDTIVLRSCHRNNNEGPLPGWYIAYLISLMHLFLVIWKQLFAEFALLETES